MRRAKEDRDAAKAERVRACEEGLAACLAELDLISRKFGCHLERLRKLEGNDGERLALWEDRSDPSLRALLP